MERKTRIEEKTLSIAKAIRSIIDSKPFIREALAKGIVNYSALAEYFKDDIQEITKINKPISKESLIAAIIRYSKDFDTKSPISDAITETVANLTFSVKTNIWLLDIDKKDVEKQHFLKIYEKFEVESENVLMVFQGIRDMIFVADENNFFFLKKLFGDTLKTLQKNMAVFNIHNENIPIYIPGYLNFFTQILAENNVNIEIYSSKDDLTLLINENDVGKVYDLLNKIKLTAKKILKKK